MAGAVTLFSWEVPDVIREAGVVATSFGTPVVEIAPGGLGVSLSADCGLAEGVVGGCGFAPAWDCGFAGTAFAAPLFAAVPEMVLPGTAAAGLLALTAGLSGTDGKR